MYKEDQWIFYFIMTDLHSMGTWWWVLRAKHYIVNTQYKYHLMSKSQKCKCLARSLNSKWSKWLLYWEHALVKLVYFRQHVFLAKIVFCNCKFPVYLFLILPSVTKKVFRMSRLVSSKSIIINSVLCDVICACFWAQKKIIIQKQDAKVSYWILSNNS